jgi:hypothetical protein
MEPHLTILHTILITGVDALLALWPLLVIGWALLMTAIALFSRSVNLYRFIALYLLLLIAPFLLRSLMPPLPQEQPIHAEEPQQR